MVESPAMVRLLVALDDHIGRFHRRWTPVERLAPWVGAVLFALLSVVPFLFHHEAEFKSDDFLLIARGAETGIMDGLVRNFVRPFCDTWTIEFYRPLFTWSFCIDANLLGAQASLYLVENLVWHVLAVGLGYLVLRHLIGARFAALSTILFIVNPWAANNISWFAGRCTVVCTAFMFLGALVHLRRMDRELREQGRAGLPWLEFAIVLVAVFYRETALFLVVLIFLLDLAHGRRDLRAFRDWCFLTAPFVIYLLCKRIVLGTWIGGYARIAALQGLPVRNTGTLDVLGEWGGALSDLFIPGDGGLAASFELEPVRWAQMALLTALTFLALFKSPKSEGRRMGGWLFVFAILHIAPILAVDSTVHGGTAQRWYTVMWAIAGVYGAMASRSRLPNLASVVVIGLAAMSAVRLNDNLADYDASARLSIELRHQIERAGNDLVFVYNVMPYDGASAFYAVGMGQSQLPPFSDGTKSVYPVFLTEKFGPSYTDQTPIAPWLHHEGVPLSALWMDLVNRKVSFLPPRILEGGYARYVSMPRLPIRLIQDGRDVTAQDVITNVTDLDLEIDARGLERIDLHVMAPISEIRFSRYRGQKYWSGEFDDDRFHERLRDMLESVTLLDGPSKGRCWLWVVAYDRVSDTEGLEPSAVSVFKELRVVIPQSEPLRRP
ncbi:MAG TPA: hypothetical protein ENK43_12470 [Planctomycetes bacterium]|nr:hypothetical protein [Planctomycetota bacterium]